MSVDRPEHKSKLSKNILEMKFMQRSALREIKAESEESRIDEEHWVLDIPQLKEKDSQFVMESSYSPCEELFFGRMSYKGFNPEIEKLMNSMRTDQELALAEEREKEMGVDDEEMTERYKSLVGTIAKKFTKKRHRQDMQEESNTEVEEILSEKKTKKKEKKRKFLKPAE